MPTKKKTKKVAKKLGMTIRSLLKARKKPGGSNVGKKRKTSGPTEGPFCGPSGGAPKGSYPVTSEGQAKSAILYSRHAPNPAGIIRCVMRIAKKRGWTSAYKMAKTRLEKLKEKKK